MNSVRSKLANKPNLLPDKNRTKSVAFLVALLFVLIAAILLSLRAGSYNTPIIELIKGIFGKAADKKINIVVRNN